MASPPPVILHLGLFFDGTGNHSANTRDEDASNIAKLFQLYPHESGAGYLRLYVEGIGTMEGLDDSLFSLATGRGSLGWLATLEKAYSRIVALLQRWMSQHVGRTVDLLEVDLFGFSRGAACARHFANDLEAGSQSKLGRLLQPLRLRGQHRAASPALRIGFIGLFDTVASIKGIGMAPQLGLRAGMARSIVHLVADDELRYHFPLSSAGIYDLSVPGSHSDVGGGYPPLTQETLVLTRPDDSYIAPRQPVESAASHKRATALLQAQSASAPDWGFAKRVRVWEKPIQSQGRGDRVEELLVHAAVEGRREVRNELSLLYLQVMYTLAVAAGVKLEAMPSIDYPAELLPVAQKLLAYACGDSRTSSLTEAEKALLYRRYIHHSHHWTTRVLGQTSDLNTLFVNRPEPNGKRRILLS